MPWPRRSAVLGAAMLLAVAGGAVHLSSVGTALPVAQEPVAAPSAAAEPHGPAPAASGSGAGETTERAAASPSAPASTEVVVHVTGAVRAPGVVDLPPGARVDDALAAAGGPREDADLAAVNLARPAVDGEQIHVPVPGEAMPSAQPGPAPADEGAGAAAAPDAGTDATIDINTADAAALDELPGVGPAIAQRIIDHRERNGPFTSVDDLEQVPGIGPATVDRLRDRASV